MATVAQQRRGNKVDRPTLAVGQLGWDLDKSQLVSGGNQGNVNISRNPITNKMHDGTIVNNRISFLTDGIGDKGVDFEYEEGNKTEFKVLSDVVAPVTMVIDNGNEIPVVDINGDPVDIAKNTIYVVWYTENAPNNVGTPVFQLAPRGGGGGVITGDVTPIYGKQEKTGSEVDRTTPLQVVGQPYDTSGNGGRKLVRLNNGTLVACLENSTHLMTYASVDDGLSWQLKDDFFLGSAFNHSIETDGVNVFVVYAFVTGVKIYVLDSQFIRGPFITIDNLQDNMGECSIIRGSNGDLHVAWSSKNTNIPNSFNIRYSKSSNDGVTWEAPTQITTTNSVGFDSLDPSIIVRNDGNPSIVYSFASSGTNTIRCENYTGTWSSTGTVYAGGSYSQSKPSSDVLENGTIIATWYGKDSTDTTVNNIRFSQSLDGGVTWSTLEKLTNGNVYNQSVPSITRNSSNVISIVWSGITPVSGGFGIARLIQGSSLAWDSIEEIDSTPSTTQGDPSTCGNYRETSKPLTLFKRTQTGDVAFYGKWGTFVVLEVLLATVFKDSFIYCNEPTTLTLNGGGTQNIPSINQATSEQEIKALENGTLATDGGLQKQYVGNVSKVSLGFTPI